MEFGYIGHTSLPGMYKKLEAEAVKLNRTGMNVQSVKGLRTLLTDFENKSFTSKSMTVDRFIDLSFFFTLDWCLVQDISYYAPSLIWVYKEVPRTDEQTGIVKGSLQTWLYLSELDKHFQLPSNLIVFVQRLKSYLESIL